MHHNPSFSRFGIHYEQNISKHKHNSGNKIFYSNRQIRTTTGKELTTLGAIVHSISSTIVYAALKTCIDAA